MEVRLRLEVSDIIVSRQGMGPLALKMQCLFEDASAEVQRRSEGATSCLCRSRESMTGYRDRSWGLEQEHTYSGHGEATHSSPSRHTWMFG